MNRHYISTAVAALLITFALIAGGCRHPAASGQAVDPAVLRKLQGSWLSYEYMTSLDASRSPVHSAAHIDGLLSFICDSAHRGHDTLYLTALMRGRENHDLCILLGSRDSAGCYAVRQLSNADADAAPGDNIIRAHLGDKFLTFYTAAADSTRFIHYEAGTASHAADYVLKRYTTMALFSGAYTTMDSDVIFRSSMVTFDPGRMGGLVGSAAFDSFDINIDVLAQTDTLDYMEFFDTHGLSESRSYSYRIEGDDIHISPLAAGAPCRLTRLVADTTLAD